MELLDYIVIFIYFLGLIAVSVVMSRKIKNSERFRREKASSPVFCREG